MARPGGSDPDRPGKPVSSSGPSRPGDPPPERKLPWTGLANLLCVYVVWGSTYLAIRVAVRDGGFAPFWLGATRTLTAGTLLLAWNLIRKSRVRPTRREWGTLVASGLLLWVGGNGLVNWGERRAASGYAALLVGTLPVWVAIVESVLDRRPPPARLAGAVLVGFAGLFVLSWPVLRTGGRADLAAVGALVLAPLSWGIGSLIQKRRPVSLSPTASSAIQQLVGGVGFVLVSLLLREPKMHPTGETWLAWSYLVAAGSLVAFTSYIQALRLLPTTLVMTYSYANPVIAVFLGWLLLGEPVTRWTAIGAALVLAGVAGVFRSRAAGMHS